MRAVLWSIRRPHTDNIKCGKKRDEIRKRIPKDLTSDTVNYIYETKANGGCGNVIGEFRVYIKTYIYADLRCGEKYLYNWAFIMPAISREELFRYLYDGGKNDGWALHISDLEIYDEPRELSEFIIPSYGHGCVNDGKCRGCRFFDSGNGFNVEDDCNAHFCTDDYKPMRKPPQSWCYVEELP